MVNDKIFIYLRIRAGDETFHRTRVRELGGLSGLTADLMREAVEGGVSIAPPPGTGPVSLEYVDASSEEVLIRFGAEPERSLQIIEGRIPGTHRAAMLDPERTKVSMDRFEERATRDLDASDRAEVEERLDAPRPDISALIRDALKPDGTFRIEIPLAAGS